MDEEFPVFRPSASNTPPETFSKEDFQASTFRTTSKKIILQSKRQSPSLLILVFIVGVIIGLATGVLFGFYH
jgi:hypothetical protein